LGNVDRDQRVRKVRQDATGAPRIVLAVREDDVARGGGTAKLGRRRDPIAFGRDSVRRLTMLCDGGCIRRSIPKDVPLAINGEVRFLREALGAPLVIPASTHEDKGWVGRGERGEGSEARGVRRGGVRRGGVRQGERGEGERGNRRPLGSPSRSLGQSGGSSAHQIPSKFGSLGKSKHVSRPLAL